MKFVRLVAPCSFVVFALACSESTPDPVQAGDGGVLDAGDAAIPDVPEPATPCADALAAIYGDPGPLTADPAQRGAILKCAKDADLSKEALQAKLTEIGYKGKAVTSGARVYRVAFRTERGNAASTPAVSGAIVYVPTAPAAAKLPTVIAARGSRGQAPDCATSKLDAAGEVNSDFYRLAYPLVGHGFALIAPDLAGYANFGAAGNPPSVYAGAADVGRSTLDGGRALKKLFPGLDDKVFLVGHSQGGHSALASLALAPSYGTSGPIGGVAVYAPLWFSQRTWGAALLSGESTKPGREVGASSIPAVTAWYHYTHAELLDGPGEGKKLFAAGKQDAIKEWVDTACWGDYEKLKTVGSHTLELFDPAFAGAVRSAAAGIAACDDADAVCKKWIARYVEDRPHLTGAAAQAPILMLYGGKDTTIPADRMKCGLDRLQADKANLTVCFDPERGHSTILNERADYVSEWLASLSTGAAAPAACPGTAAQLTEPCATPPPND